MGAVQQELKQSAETWDKLKEDIGDAVKRSSKLGTRIQTLKNQLAEAEEEVMQLGQRDADLAQKGRELATATQNFQAKFHSLMVEQPQTQALKERAKGKISDVMSAWDSFKADLQGEL